MICITCGKNEAVNDFYKECQECIENFQREKEMKESRKMEFDDPHDYPKESYEGF